MSPDGYYIIRIKLRSKINSGPISETFALHPKSIRAIIPTTMAEKPIEIKTPIPSLQEIVNKYHYCYDCLTFLESNGKQLCPLCSIHIPGCGGGAYTQNSWGCNCHDILVAELQKQTRELIKELNNGRT
jgi:hypothetical protein